MYYKNKHIVNDNQYNHKYYKRWDTQKTYRNCLKSNPCFIDGSGTLHANQMFRTSAEANGEGLDPEKMFKINRKVTIRN